MVKWARGKEMLPKKRDPKKLAMVIAGLIFIWLCSVGYAQPGSAKEPIIEHLEFLGYECDLIESGVRAKHRSNIHLYISYAFGGIRIQTGFPGNSPHADVGSRYRVTNSLMKQFSVLQLFWSDDGNLFAMAWMPGLYEKGRFTRFLEAWDRDISVLRQSYDELKPFLKKPAKDSEEGA